MLDEFNRLGNKSMVRKLMEAPVTQKGGTPDEYLALRDKAMHRLGIGTTHDMNSIITGLFFPSLAFKEYTLKEKVNLWRAKAHSGVSILWDTILVTDLTKQVREIDLPVYFFHGLYDYTVSYPLAKKYFEEIKARGKGFYTFHKSAHSPIFEEPLLINRILEEDVLKNKFSLSDKKP